MPDAASSLLSPEFLAQLERLELVTRKIFHGRMKGERRSKRKGQSSEFADFRTYVVGDDLRFLDWNLYARLDRLFLRLFLEEEDLHLYLLLDASASMDFGSPSKFQFARQVAAALGFIGLANLDRVVIHTVGSTLQTGLPPLRGRRSLWRMLDHLEKIQPGGPGDLMNSLRRFAVQGSGKGIVILLSDFLDREGYSSALRYLVARNMDLFAIHILSEEELDPDLTGDIQLVDVEDGVATELTAHPALLRRYRENLESFCQDLERFCMQRGIHYCFARTGQPFDRLVLDHLRSRGLVR